MRFSGDLYQSDIRLYNDLKCYLRETIYSNISNLTEICNIIAMLTGSKDPIIDRVVGLDVIRFSIPENNKISGYEHSAFWAYEFVNTLFHTYIQSHSNIDQRLLEYNGFYNAVQIKCIGNNSFEIVLL